MNKVELEKAYNLGLKLEKMGDFNGAELAYKRALSLDPDDHCGVRIRLAAIGKGAAPSDAPLAYVATLFDQTADAFDYILVDQLKYDVPDQLRICLDELFPGKIYSRFLDLGCGTGLCAEALDGLLIHKTGVDISKNMVEIAGEKGDYDSLFISNALDFLISTKTCWDLIVATDVLPYMGDIKSFFKEISKHLDDKGLFAFSTENLDSYTPHYQITKEGGYMIGPHHRYAHAPEYLTTVLAENQLAILTRKAIIVREEQGEPVNGELYVVTKK